MEPLLTRHRAVADACKSPSKSAPSAGQGAGATVLGVRHPLAAAEPRPQTRTTMSITELHDEPESRISFDDDGLATLAPAFPMADVDELRRRVHGPVYAAGDDGLAAEVATWN